MDEHVKAAQLMVQAHEVSETMLEAVNLVERQCPAVIRDHLILIWFGVNAKDVASNRTHQPGEIMNILYSLCKLGILLSSLSFFGALFFLLCSFITPEDWALHTSTLEHRTDYLISIVVSPFLFYLFLKQGMKMDAQIENAGKQ